MDWIKLVNGDEKNLQGKVIAYSIFKNEDPKRFSDFKNGQIVALYGSTNIQDYINKIGAPEGLLIIDKLENKLISEYSKILGYKIEINKIYGESIEIESEKELFSMSEDIIFVGEYSHPSTCQNAAKSGIEFYILKFIEQSQKRPPIKKQKIEELREELKRVLKMEHYEAAKVIQKQINKLKSEK